MNCVLVVEWYELCISGWCELCISGWCELCISGWSGVNCVLVGGVV